jgi:hypothetical protein
MRASILQPAGQRSAVWSAAMMAIIIDPELSFPAFGLEYSLYGFTLDFYIRVYYGSYMKNFPRKAWSISNVPEKEYQEPLFS